MSEKQRRLTRQNTRTPKRKKKRSKFPLLIVVLIIAAVIFTWRISALMSEDMRGSAENSVTVEIPSGSTVTEIAEILEENGIVDSAAHFKFLCKTRGVGSEFKSGAYEFGGDETFESLVDKLDRGAVSSDAIVVTVKEGQWLSEIAQSVAEAGICTAGEFLAAADSRDYDYDFIKDIPDRANLLEGYLYPETYYFDKNTTAEDVVNTMLAQFDKVCRENEIEKDAQKMDMTLDEAVIIASLIESEVKYEPERTKVSSVIHNRLSQNMKLQIDASVIYSLGERVTRVYYSDLEKADPHNTYYVDGLPSGPICSPRGASLKAAVNPDSTDYLYYVVEDRETGEHHFSSDYADFEKAMAKYKESLNN